MTSNQLQIGLAVSCVALLVAYFIIQNDDPKKKFENKLNDQLKLIIENQKYPHWTQEKVKDFFIGENSEG